MLVKSRPVEGQPVSKRMWRIDAAYIERSADDPNEIARDLTGRALLTPNPNFVAELAELLTDFEVLLSRIGGTVAIVADRARIGDGPEDYATLGITARWEAFSPVRDLRLREAPETEEPLEQEDDDPFSPDEDDFAELSADELDQHFPEDVPVEASATED